MDLKLDLERLLMDVDNDTICVGEEHGVSDSCVGIEAEERHLGRKRKKECCLPLLDWVKRVAGDPCDPMIGSVVPESSKWKAYGNEHVWKQVLLAREAVRLKVNGGDSGAKRSFSQKKQKMHPDMYDDGAKKLNTRTSQRRMSSEENLSTLLSRKPEGLEYSELSPPEGDAGKKDILWACSYRKKRIPLGRAFQAEVPKWTNETQESETKWLGTRVWPLEATETRASLIEREPIGKGRRDSCGCHVIGSVECVRFHVAEKRSRLKLELGSAFVKWKFDTMGQDVSLEWAETDENKFADIIKSNPRSSGWRFWDVLITSFTNKMRRELVSYYFNAYLLGRRAHQNRADPSNVDSDDDELEKFGCEVNKPAESLLSSPKGHLKYADYF